jgi:hypothetical protein
MIMSGKAVLENVRRYRAIASLYRRTAAFRPPQRFSLLGHAKLESTVRYLGIEVDDALNMAEQIEL